jgi:hypothetical protein
MSGANDQQACSDATSQNKPVLALPSISEDEATKLDMSSGQGTAKLDALGPMVVNVDGTLSRITNWDKMAEIERKNTLRIINKRNKERLEKLQVEQGEDGKNEGSN